MLILYRIWINYLLWIKVKVKKKLVCFRAIFKLFLTSMNSFFWSLYLKKFELFSLKIIPYNRRCYPPSWPYSTEIFGRCARLPHTQELILWQWVCRARPHSRECKQLYPSPFLPEYPGSQSTSFSFLAARFFSHLTLGGRWLHLSQLCWKVGSLCSGLAKRSPAPHTFC